MTKKISWIDRLTLITFFPLFVFITFLAFVHAVITGDPCFVETWLGADMFLELLACRSCKKSLSKWEVSERLTCYPCLRKELAQEA